MEGGAPYLLRILNVFDNIVMSNFAAESIAFAPGNMHDLCGTACERIFDDVWHCAGMVCWHIESFDGFGELVWQFMVI